jgi:HPt (histidine-containing phosphotransfer) domain-containing protein
MKKEQTTEYKQYLEILQNLIDRYFELIEELTKNIGEEDESEEEGDAHEEEDENTKMKKEDENVK